MGLKTGWDFTKEKDTLCARETIIRDQPHLVIGSPPCMASSTLQKMNEANWRGRPNKERKRQAAWNEAVKHVEFRVGSTDTSWNMDGAFYRNVRWERHRWVCQPYNLYFKMIR